MTDTPPLAENDPGAIIQQQGDTIDRLLAENARLRGGIRGILTTLDGHELAATDEFMRGIVEALNAVLRVER